MTIFDTGYSSLQYEPVSPLTRIWSLTRTEYQKIFKSKKGLVLFIACVIYVVVLLVLVHVNLGPESQDFREGLRRMSPRFSPFDVEFYLGYSTQQGFLAFILLTTIVSVRSIAADKAVNALEIYWTRGIGPWGYFVGKWSGSFLLLASVFVSGPLVAWLYGLVSAPDGAFLKETIQFVPYVLVALVIKCLVLSFLAVAFSALSSSPNIVTFLWLILIIGSGALVALLKKLSRGMRDPLDVDGGPEWFGALSPWDAIVRIEEQIAGLASITAYPVWMAWTSLGILGAFLLWRLRRHLRTTEAMV